MSPAGSVPSRIEELVEALVVAHLESDDTRVAHLLAQVLGTRADAEEAFCVAVGRLLSLLVLLGHPDPQRRLVVEESDRPFGIFSQVVSRYYDPDTGARLDRPSDRPHSVS
jgi:hypothetical protein